MDPEHNHTLSDIRRVVTEHDSAGRSIFRSDETLQPTKIPSADALFALVWTTAQVPADNIADTAGAQRNAGLTIKGGSVIRIVDFPPRVRSPMHRSHSIDYGLVLRGAIDLELDSGEVKQLKLGDIVVQRGTSHLWLNPSDTEWARMAFILIEATPVVVNGKELDDHLL